MVLNIAKMIFNEEDKLKLYVLSTLIYVVCYGTLYKFQTSLKNYLGIILFLDVAVVLYNKSKAKAKTNKQLDELYNLLHSELVLINDKINKEQLKTPNVEFPIYKKEEINNEEVCLEEN